MKRIPQYYHVILTNARDGDTVAKYTYTRRDDAQHCYDELLKERVAEAMGAVKIAMQIEYVSELNMARALLGMPFPE